ncbi:tetratricopeptide repeat protein [Nocardia brasiliensis]|uniref:tetratricopeptide repeat protein n=1 Tax=Nocardia brasiliensis TaxID=37326 RepID=UPI002454CBE8|nr:toll/interleukin-1 receptor domain-containing protein [Nocardia brasiliensis]
MFDVFLCYNWDYKSWADELHAALRARNVSVFQDDKDIRPNHSLAPAIEAALNGSRMLVPLIGPTFHESPSCRVELHTALRAAYYLEEGRTERVLPIIWRVSPEELLPSQLKRGRLTKREALDTNAQAELIAERVTELARLDSRRLGDAPAGKDPEWLPLPLPGNKQFYGRELELWRIHDALQVKGKPGNQGHPVVSIRGTAGEGKTAVCEQFARLFARDHPGGVITIRLSGNDRTARADPLLVSSTFHQELRAIAARLSIDAARLDLDTLIATIGNYLRDRAPYLWIVDDVPTTGIDESLLRSLQAPTGNGKTLLTTRGQLSNLVSSEIQLAPLDSGEAVAVLTHRHALPEGRSAERDAARGIVEDLNGHALGLKLVAGLTTLPTFTTYATLRDELNRTDPDRLENADHMADELPLGYSKSLSAIMIRSMSALDDAGREVLALASVLAAAPIPAELVDAVLAVRASVTGPQGLRNLEARGLADYLGDGSYLLHVLTARAARFHFAVQYRKQFHDIAADVIGHALESGRDHIDLTRALSRYLPHARVLATTPEWQSGRTEWQMLGEAGRAHYELGDPTGALMAFEYLRELCEESPDADEDTRVAILVNLGAAYFGHNELPRARELQEQAVERLTASKGVRHADTLQAQDNLANTLSAQGDYLAARKLLEHVYRLRRKTEEGTTRKRLVTLNNLVIVLSRYGSRRHALRLGLAAWALWQRSAGPDAPETLEAVENLANTMLRLGQHHYAADTYAYLADRRRAVLGPGHPDTIDAVENLATARLDSYWAIYADRLREQGPEHPDTQHTLRQLIRTNLNRVHTDTDDHELLVVAPADLPTDATNLADEDAEWLSELVVSAIELDAQLSSKYRSEDPRALRVRILLAHALALADQYEDHIDVALNLAADARDGLAEAVERIPDEVEEYDLPTAKIVHRWILRLSGEESTY